MQHASHGKARLRRGRRITNDATLSTARLPEAQAPRSTSRAKMDEVIDRLLDGATKFRRCRSTNALRSHALCRTASMRVAEASVKATCAAKGIPLEHHGAEWALGPWIPVRAFRLIIEALEALERRGNTPIGRIGHTRDDRLAVRVFPANSIDSVLFRTS